MKDIVKILESQGITLTDEQSKAVIKEVSENYKTIAEHDKKVTALELERDNYKTQLETASKTLKTFDGIEPDKIKDQLDEYEKKLKTLDEEHKKELYHRDFGDALKAAVGEYKFSSKAAEKSVMKEIEDAGLKLVDGKIVGLKEMMEIIKERDASAFVDEQTENAKQTQARFTKPVTGKGSGKVTMSELMRMKNENPNLDISSYMNGKDDK